MKAVDTIDHRNEVRKLMDMTVRAIHQDMGNELTGYVVIAWGDDPSVVKIGHCVGSADPETFPEFIGDCIEAAMVAKGEEL